MQEYTRGFSVSPGELCNIPGNSNIAPFTGRLKFGEVGLQTERDSPKQGLIRIMKPFTSGIYAYMFHCKHRPNLNLNPASAHTCWLILAKLLNILKVSFRICKI